MEVNRPTYVDHRYRMLINSQFSIIIEVLSLKTFWNRRAIDKSEDILIAGISY